MVLVIKCEKHPKYIGRYKPRIKCEGCKIVYQIGKSNANLVVGEQILSSAYVKLNKPLGLDKS